MEEEEEEDSSEEEEEEEDEGSELQKDRTTMHALVYQCLLEYRNNITRTSPRGVVGAAGQGNLPDGRWGGTRVVPSPPPRGLPIHDIVT